MTDVPYFVMSLQNHLLHLFNRIAGGKGCIHIRTWVSTS